MTIFQPEVALSNIMTRAWAAMAASGTPSWLNGEPWVKWSYESQISTFLDPFKQESQTMDHASKCSVIETAISEAISYDKHKSERNSI